MAACVCLLQGLNQYRRVVIWRQCYYPRTASSRSRPCTLSNQRWRLPLYHYPHCARALIAADLLSRIESILHCTLPIVIPIAVISSSISLDSAPLPSHHFTIIIIALSPHCCCLSILWHCFICLTSIRFHLKKILLFPSCFQSLQSISVFPEHFVMRKCCQLHADQIPEAH